MRNADGVEVEPVVPGFDQQEDHLVAAVETVAHRLGHGVGLVPDDRVAHDPAVVLERERDPPGQAEQVLGAHARRVPPGQAAANVVVQAGGCCAASRVGVAEVEPAGSVAGWAREYVTERGDAAREGLEQLGLSWGPKTADDLRRFEGPIDIIDVPEAIREAAVEYEPAVRQAMATDAPYELTIETTDVDAYWTYWLDGSGQRVRLRLNLRDAEFTAVGARQFALHEILGHGLQGASFAARCAREDVPWVRLMSVHAPQQVLLEGLAQAMPLFITPDDEILIARVRLDHYTQLVRAEIHVALNANSSIEACARYAADRVPWWSDAQISSILTDRGADPLPSRAPTQT
jgi:hypothetical protein